ncbi:MAG TPA: carboxypeptidase-like regulatory domain-containing protein [Pyrinomonadaceae bacterium]|jgi:hypothetical protein|nr:carboxypeptidase-like regulatory domain-containing protein [Pyrinomonadaceae bacterium]
MKNYFKSASLLLVANCALLISTLQAQSTTPYAISGIVHDNAGAAVADARVCASQAERGKDVLCAKSDKEGRFTLKLKEAGTYLLVPEKLADGYVAQYLSFFRAPTPSITEVVLNSANAHPFVSIMIGPKNGTLRGSLMDTTSGLPLENVQLTLCLADEPSDCFSTRAKSADGSFNISAPHVPFTLKINADGYEDWFGMSGAAADREAPLYIASGTTMELNVYMKRRKEARDKKLSEAEKEAGVNLAAPVQLSPAENKVFDFFPRTTKLEWAAVEGAVSYTVEVDYCLGGERGVKECVNPQPFNSRSNPPMSGLTSTSYEFKFIGAQPGRWRVWAVDREGREGFKSPWRTFVYLQ